MQGHPRPGCRTVSFSVNTELLKEFDALIEPFQRGRELEKLMKAKIVQHKLGKQLPALSWREGLALID